MRWVAVVMGIVLCLVLTASGDIYIWVDGNGVKHYSNEAPAGGQEVDREAEIRHSSDQYRERDKSRHTAQEKMLEEGQSGDAAGNRQAGANKSVAKKPGDVVIYTKPTCPYCAQAKAFFAKYGIAYTEYDITADKQARERFKKLNGRGVPLIFIGEKRISGFNEGWLRRLFGIKPS
jgi:glutaredoxin